MHVMINSTGKSFSHFEPIFNVEVVVDARSKVNRNEFQTTMPIYSLSSKFIENDMECIKCQQVTYNADIQKSSLHAHF